MFQHKRLDAKQHKSRLQDPAIFLFPPRPLFLWHTLNRATQLI